MQLTPLLNHPREEIENRFVEYGFKRSQDGYWHCLRQGIDIHWTELYEIVFHEPVRWVPARAS